MKKILIMVILVMALIAIVPMVIATDTGSSTGITVTTQPFTPRVFLCDNRTLIDDNLENGNNGLLLSERKHNYAFTGESIHWLVLVVDKNKIEAVTDVVGALGNTSGSDDVGTPVECSRISGDPFSNTTINSTVSTTTNVICTANVTLAPPGVNVTCNVNGVISSVFTPVTGLLNLQVNGTNISVNVGSGTVDFNSTIGGINGGCSVSNLAIPLNLTGSCSFSITNSTNVTTFTGIGDPFAECGATDNQFDFTTFDPSIMSFYDCTFTVGDPSSDQMYGKRFLTIEAQTSDPSVSGTMAENEYWFLNPIVAISSDGTLAFDNANHDGTGVEPGTTAYSNTILVGNDADAGSGVMMDMFISGTDFYDPSSSGARCPSTNQLALTNFGYYATNGAFSTNGNIGADAQGYLPIPYSTDISGSKRIIRFTGMTGGLNCSDTINTTSGIVLRANAIRGASPSSSVVEQDWNCGNALSPGAQMPLTFKLNLPEPCIGDFSNGNIYFWGEAI